LDELPLHLIPAGCLDRTPLKGDPAQPLVLNPHCSVLPAGEIPPELVDRQDLLEDFCLAYTMAWVRDPATGSLHPFGIGPELSSLLSRLHTGDAVPTSLSQQWKLVLTQAGIVVPLGHAEHREEQWRKTSREAAQVFRERDFAVFGGLIHPLHVAALRRYYRHQIRKGSISLGDEQCSRRYVAHNENVARYFHHQIANAVSAIVGEPVKPSYVYFASYVGGAELKKHTDRAQCEFSVSLSLDFSPEPERATSWPLHLDTSEGRVTVYQGLGDGLVYRGTKVPHYRDLLPEGRSSTSIFFHYVPADFAGPLD
jgi:hypothetical protein